MAHITVGDPQPLAANRAAGQTPGDVLSVAALAVACGILLAWPNGRALWTSLRYLTQAHYGVAGERLAELSGFMTTLVPIAVAAGLVVCGLGILKRIRTARGLGIVLGVAIAFGEVVVSHRTGWQTVTLVCGIALAFGLASLPGVRTHIESKEGSTGSAVASVAISFVAWVYLALGAGVLAAAAANSSDPAVAQYRGFGVTEILLAVVVLALTAPVRRGEPGPSRLATVLLAALAVSLATGQRWASPFHLDLLPLGYALAIAISLGAAVAAWPRGASAAAPAVPIDDGAPPQRAKVSAAAKTGLIGGALVLVVAGVLAVSPNHSSQGVAFNSSATPLAPGDLQPSSTPAAAPAAPVVAGATTHSWNFSMTRPGGYVFNAVVGVGDPVHMTAGLTNGNDTAGSACSIDAQADAVMPFTISLVNATSGFSSGVGVTFVLAENANAGGLPLLAEMHYSSGPTCSTESANSATVGLASLQPILPGRALYGSGFLVVRGYYTPNHPDGDAAALGGDGLQLAPAQGFTDAGGSSTQFSIGSVQGPGVTTGTFGEWTLNLAGEGASPSASPSVASAAASPTSGPSVTEADFTTTWSFVEALPDGRQSTVTLAAGDPRPFQNGLTNGGDVLGSCPFTAADVAVVPFELTLGTSQGGPVGIILFGFGADSIPGILGPGLYAERDTDVGGQGAITCGLATKGATLSVLPSADAASSSSLVVHGFFTISKYYNGVTDSAAILRDTIMTLPSQEVLTAPGAQSSGPKVTFPTATGPGLGKDSSGDWTFDLAGVPAVPAG